MTAIWLLALSISGDADGWSAAQQRAVDAARSRQSALVGWAREIWSLSEPAFQEFQSSKLLADALEKEGFRVQRGAAQMKTAFVGEFGAGKPVIAILAEYDALPGLAQDAVPRRSPRPRSAAGHGCGHNLFGAASVGAALAVKQAMIDGSLKGTIRIYGCPAEEGGGGKVYMVRAGLFADVDAALHWHPSTSNDASASSCLAVVRFRASFRGRSAHAAASPWEGRSALDAVELTNIGVNFLREHVPSTARIHYVITNGGLRPNVVPDVAEGWYYIRSPQMQQALEIVARVEKIVEGAGLMTETEPTIKAKTGTYELLPNAALAAVVDASLRRIGPPKFTEQDRRFAAELRQSIGAAEDRDLRSGSAGPLDERIAPFRVDEKSSGGSTDVGDVSWTVPTAGLRTATAARGAPAHSWSFVACSGSPLGEKGMAVACETLAASAVALFENPGVLHKAKAEFEERRRGRPYQSVLEEGPPPERLDAGAALGSLQSPSERTIAGFPTHPQRRETP